jgi:hypothetical protein
MIIDILLFLSLSVSLTYLCCMHFLWFACLCLYFIPRVKIKKSWFNWFEIVKLLSCITGVYVINVHPDYTHYIVILNIFEAIIIDKYTVNSILGILVVIFINFESLFWIIIYSIWNACFTYTYGFSWSTRVVLLTPVVLYRITGWVKARAYSLLINMMLRSIEFTYLFQSGKSFLTY